MTRAGLFVSGTTTGAGKTTITAGLARALVARGRSVAAIKPLETGVEPVAEDAVALAHACGRPALADDPDWYRARVAASPYAAALEGEAAPDLARIVARIARIDADFLLCEGAGGLLVPVDRDHTIADLACSLAMPLLLVAPDRLGVLSDVLAIHEAARHRDLSVAAIVLSATTRNPDLSARTNARILRERIAAPVVSIGHGESIEPLLDALAIG